MSLGLERANNVRKEAWGSCYMWPATLGMGSLFSHG